MTILDGLTEEEAKELLKIQNEVLSEESYYVYLMDKLEEITEFILDRF